MDNIVSCAIKAVLETKKGNEIGAATYLQTGGPVAVNIYLTLLKIKED